MAKKNTIRPKIMKLLMALKVKHGKIYLYSLDRVWSQKLEKICVLRKLEKLNPATGKKEKILSGFREVDILLKLVDIYKALEKGGDDDDSQEGKDDTG